MGRDKAALLLAGRTLLQRVVDVAAQLTDELVVVDVRASFGP